MKKAFYLLFFITILFACKEYDELVPEVELRTIPASQAAIIQAFAGLTDNDTSLCNIVYEPEEIPEILCRVVQCAEEGSEMVFLVDHTTSMNDDIDTVKKNILKIIDCLPDGVRLAIATYGDVRDGSNWYSRTELTTDFESIKEYVLDISTRGGYTDCPESIYDGVWRTLDEMNWTDCDAPDKIIVMGDSLPLEGSKTTHSLADVLSKAESICGDTRFFPIIILDQTSPERC